MTSSFHFDSTYQETDHTERPQVSSKDAAMLAARASTQKGAISPILLNITDFGAYADFILVLSGRSVRQCKAIAEFIESQLKDHGVDPIGREGLQGVSSGQWILLDFGELVVHIFHEPVREYYDIEGLWIEAEKIDIQHMS